jgi:hypothetical protein
MATTETKPGERTAKFVHAGTHLHFANGADDSYGWSVYVAAGDPYEENGEFWVEAKERAVDTETFPVALHSARMGI